MWCLDLLNLDAILHLNLFFVNGLVKLVWYDFLEVVGETFFLGLRDLNHVEVILLHRGGVEEVTDKADVALYEALGLLNLNDLRAIKPFLALLTLKGVLALKHGQGGPPE